LSWSAGIAIRLWRATPILLKSEADRILARDRWNWHDNYDAEASPDQKWVKVSDAGEAAFRKRDAEAKAS
jgi:hypothetical protein